MVGRNCRCWAYNQGCLSRKEILALAKGLRGLFLQGITIIDDVLFGPLPKDDGCYEVLDLLSEDEAI